MINTVYDICKHIQRNFHTRTPFITLRFDIATNLNRVKKRRTQQTYTHLLEYRSELCRWEIQRGNIHPKLPSQIFKKAKIFYRY